MGLRDVVVGVDADGVMIDFASVYLEILNETFDLDKKMSDITTHDFDKSVATPSQNDVVWGIINRSPGLVYNLPAFEETHVALAHLRSWAERVVCVTSPAERPGQPSTWASERLRSLMDRFGFEKHDIVISPDKWLVSGKVDALIDDLPRNLESFRLPYLVSRPWNQGVKVVGRVPSLFDASVELERETR